MSSARGRKLRRTRRRGARSTAASARRGARALLRLRAPVLAHVRLALDLEPPLVALEVGLARLERRRRSLISRPPPRVKVVGARGEAAPTPPLPPTRRRRRRAARAARAGEVVGPERGAPPLAPALRPRPAPPPRLVLGGRGGLLHGAQLCGVCCCTSISSRCCWSASWRLWRRARPRRRPGAPHDVSHARTCRRRAGTSRPRRLARARASSRAPSRTAASSASFDRASRSSAATAAAARGVLVAQLLAHARELPLGVLPRLASELSRAESLEACGRVRARVRRPSRRATPRRRRRRAPPRRRATPAAPRAVAGGRAARARRRGGRPPPMRQLLSDCCAARRPSPRPRGARPTRAPVGRGRRSPPPPPPPPPAGKAPGRWPDARPRRRGVARPFGAGVGAVTGTRGAASRGRGGAAARRTRARARRRRTRARPRTRRARAGRHGRERERGRGRVALRCRAACSASAACARRRTHRRRAAHVAHGRVGREKPDAEIAPTAEPGPRRSCPRLSSPCRRGSRPGKPSSSSSAWSAWKGIRLDHRLALSAA